MDFKSEFSGTCSARFFKITKKITRSKIKCVTDAAAGPKAEILHEGHLRKIPDELEGRYSFSVFKKHAKVLFLPEQNLKEVFYGFFVGIELGDYFVTFSSRAVGTDDEVGLFAEPVNVADILVPVTDSGSDLRKIRANSFSSGTTGCHSKTFEGANLQSALGTLSNGRHMLRNVSAKRKGKVHSLNIDLRKISKYGGRVNFSDLCKWSKSIVDEVMKGNEKNEFLETFAQSAPLEEAGEPMAILFHSWELERILLEKSEVSSARLNLMNFSILKLSETDFARYLKWASGTLEVRYQLSRI